MNNTKIDYVDSTWNVVTGCYHKCEYCYARGISKRFGGWNYSPGHYRLNTHKDKTFICEGKDFYGNIFNTKYGKIADIKEQFSLEERKAPYPFGFMPTFHRYRLDDYKNKSGRNIFVCSMADLFGEWVPDEWITEIFKACAAAPQHRYLFLTKNPKRYFELYQKGIIKIRRDNLWFGTTVLNDDELWFTSEWNNTFLSLEPLQNEFDCENVNLAIDWVIIGAETGNRKDKIIPKCEWIEDIVNACKIHNVPVFMKKSFIDIWGEPLIQEYPWEVTN